MFAICIEASHSKGMGHLFRMLNFVQYLDKKNENFIFLINNNEKTKNILISHGYKYEIVNLSDIKSDWETLLIDKYSVKYWINDRLDTDNRHVRNITKNKIKVITFDDLGSGAELSDINVCGLFFNKENIKGKTILKGVDYLILNSEIDKFRKKRDKLENIIVTLGGSDTYGVTIKILKLLKKYNIKATIHIGPSFEHKKELNQELTDSFKVIEFVPSLIEELSKYDLAITGGGITPFEANALGLPCLIVANETFEIANGMYLQSINSSFFAGFHEHINEEVIRNLEKLNIEEMSQRGLLKLNTNALEKIYKESVKL